MQDLCNAWDRRALAGEPAATGLLAPVDLEAAGTILDGYLISPTAPKETAS